MKPVETSQYLCWWIGCSPHIDCNWH